MPKRTVLAGGLIFLAAAGCAALLSTVHLPATLPPDDQQETEARQLLESKEFKDKLKEWEGVFWGQSSEKIGQDKSEGHPGKGQE